MGAAAAPRLMNRVSLDSTDVLFLAGTGIFLLGLVAITVGLLLT